jgi:ribonuclease PH
MKNGMISKMPVKGTVAATSVGIVSNKELLDLCYSEDSNADVDMNVIMTDKGEFIEIQATGEKSSFSKTQLDQLLNLAKAGIDELMKIQNNVLNY